MKSTKQQPAVQDNSESQSSTDFVTSREQDDEILVEFSSFSEDDLESFGGDVQVTQDSKPATVSPSRSRRSGQTYLQVVEEGLSVEITKGKKGQRWSCPKSCPFPATGRHGLGCTMIHEDFDLDGYDISERHYGNDSSVHHDVDKQEESWTPECTNSSVDGERTRDPSFWQSKGMTDAQLQLRRRRRAQILLLVFLTLGTIALLLVLVIPSSIMRERGDKDDLESGSMGLQWTPLDEP